MKLHPEDPRITAYVLGELKPEDAALVEKAASEDPAVQAAIDEVASTADFLGTTLFATQPKFRPAQRQQVLQAAQACPNQQCGPDRVRQPVMETDNHFPSRRRSGDLRGGRLHPASRVRAEAGGHSPSRSQTSGGIHNRQQ